MKNLEIINTAADCVELSVKRLPSGFGSVRYLGKGRCNPYAVHPPESSAKTPQSKNRRPPALCYVHSRETGIKILMIYHAGLYAPGVESDPDLLNRLYKKAIGQEDGADSVEPLSTPDPVRLQNVEKPGAGTGNLQNVPESGQAESIEDLYGRLYSLQAYINNLMEGIGRLKTNHSDLSREVLDPSCSPMPVNTDSKPALSAGHTALHRLDNAPSLNVVSAPVLSAVYTAFHQFKYGPQAAKQLSRSSRYVTAAAYKKLARFYDRSLDEISVMEWQELINETAESGNSRSAVADLVTLIRQLYRFALPRDMCTRCFQEPGKENQSGLTFFNFNQSC